MKSALFILVKIQRILNIFEIRKRSSVVKYSIYKSDPEIKRALLKVVKEHFQDPYLWK